jgi:glycosyltransferase involved in cell wall biosynthesis
MNSIDSVIKQTYSNWELIIIDDGSTDDTKNYVNSLKEPKIKYIYQNNSGPSAARNKAFSIIKGGWICYLDSDNELLPNYMDVMLTNINNHPGTLYVLAKGKRTLELYQQEKLIKSIDDSKDFLDDLNSKDIFLRKFHFDGNGFMHAKRIVDEGFRWDEKLHLLEEWDFVMTFAEKYPDAFLYIPKTLFNYHQRFGTDGLVSNAKYCEWADAFEYIYQKHKADKLLKGQTWYPNRVKKYRKLQKEF